MRLIDADPLKKRINELRHIFKGETREALSLVLVEVLKAPTAEIVSGENCAIRFKKRGE